MNLSPLRSEKGLASWVYIGAGGLLILILGIVFFASPNNTQTDESTDLLIDEIDVNRPISPDVGPLPLALVITNDGTGGLGNPLTTWSGFGDVPDFNAPPVGNFEVVDQGFNPLAVVERGSTPHLIVATNGSPPVDSYLPITFHVYDNSGAQVWTNTLDGPPSLVCRGADGCSDNGPELTELLLHDGSVLLVQAVSNDDRLLAQMALRGQAPGSDIFDIVDDPSDALPPIAD